MAPLRGGPSCCPQTPPPHGTLLAVVFGVSPVAAEEHGEHITIVRSPAAVQGPCLPAPLPLGGTTLIDDATFTVRIELSAPLCEPMSVRAAVYEMPGNGAAWPQRLREVVPFTLEAAGVVDVVFTRTCRPVQFDVVTGATPGLISPLGEWHGQLLFPFDTSTSFQHWGWDCEPAPATTAPAPATPPTTTAPTTTAPPEVLGTTSIVPLVEGDSAPPEDRPVVLAASRDASEDDRPAALAVTGANLLALLWGAAAAVFAGSSLLAARRANAPSSSPGGESNS